MNTAHFKDDIKINIVKVLTKEKTIGIIDYIGVKEPYTSFK